MKKDGVYYCMHKRDVMCAHAKKRLTAIMMHLWLKFHDFSPKNAQKGTIFADLGETIIHRTARPRNFTSDVPLTGTNSRINVINIKIPITVNKSLPRMT